MYVCTYGLITGGDSLHLLPRFSLCKPTNRKPQAEASSVSVKTLLITANAMTSQTASTLVRNFGLVRLLLCPLSPGGLHPPAGKPVRNWSHPMKIYNSINFIFCCEIIKQTPILCWGLTLPLQLTGAVSGDFLGQEDCLLLNIYSPIQAFHSKTDQALAPVLVWIYGGGFLTGSARSFISIGPYFGGGDDQWSGMMSMVLTGGWTKA